MPRAVRTWVSAVRSSRKSALRFRRRASSNPSVGTVLRNRKKRKRWTSWQTESSIGTRRSVFNLPSGTWSAHCPGASRRRQSKERSTHSPIRMPV